jgi:hypothetical protein
MNASWIWDERQPRRGWQKGTKEALAARQNGRCMYCGFKDDLAHMDIDHKTPHARNGGTNLANLQLLCHPCNLLKGNRTDGEFRKLYRLGPSRGAEPPSRRIPRTYFNQITEELKAKARTKAAAKKKKADDWGWF